MRNRTLFVLLAGFCLSAFTLTAGPIGVPVTTTASFAGGLLGNWNFDDVTGAPGLYLESIAIDLSPTDLAFDMPGSSFGSLAAESVCCFAGTDVTTGLTPGPGPLDGGILATFSFSNFVQGDSFQSVSTWITPIPR